ncbi:hypothetical protein EDD16DRAFT_1523106 [Pisolithus croceorrhizus]|nr:hypothetical protein EDD16DRAFT_1523106 [Pisolithus croceorrhizus]
MPPTMPVAKSRPVPAFYDSKPHLVPVLSSQVEIALLPGKRVHSGNFPGGDPERKTPIATTSRAQTPREQTPAPMPKGKSVTIELPSSDSEHSEGSPAPSESSLSSLESELGGSDKIPKPSGEAGRPGHGGYNLEDQLGWGEDCFKNLKVTAEFPDMDSFENCWPVLDLIQMHLKYLSSRARQKRRISGSSSRAAKGEKSRGKSPKSKS